MFKISKNKRYWVMTVPTIMIPKYKFGMKMESDSQDINLLDSMVKTVVAELDGRIGVRRMSYDTWHWSSHHEMERFLTYYYLKYGNQYPIDKSAT